MNVLENIERVAHASRADIERAILEQRPLILTGLFAGQPIQTLTSADDAVSRLGDLRLQIRPEYSFNGFEAFRTAPGASTVEMTLAGYLEHERRHAGTPLLCLEQPTPDAVSSLFSMGDLAEINSEEGDRLESRFFLGNAGNKSNLHYDRDYHATLLHQVFGRKRVILMSPRESQKLRPVMNFSEYLLCEFTPEDKAAFIRYTNAYDAILNPGETLLIPTAFWHHVEYLDRAMSFNVKLRRNRYLALLGGGLFHSNHFVQGLVTRFLRSSVVAERHADVFDRILALYVDPALGPFAKFDALDALFRELHATLCSDFPRGRYFASMTGLRESDLWRARLEEGSLYGSAQGVKAGAAGGARSP